MRLQASRHVSRYLHALLHMHNISMDMDMDIDVQVICMRRLISSRTTAIRGRQCVNTRIAQMCTRGVQVERLKEEQAYKIADAGPAAEIQAALNDAQEDLNAKSEEAKQLRSKVGRLETAIRELM